MTARDGRCLHLLPLVAAVLAVLLCAGGPARAQSEQQWAQAFAFPSRTGSIPSRMATAMLKESPPCHGNDC